MRGSRLQVSFLAFLAASAGAVLVAQNAPVPAAGIYFEQAGGTEVKIPSETSTDIQTKGIAKASLTMGLARPSQIVTHPGAHAATVITEAQPSFLFRFGQQPNRNDMAAMMAAYSGDGMPMMATSAKEFSLIRLTVEGDTRIADTGKLQRVKAEAKPVKTREFRVKVLEPLTPGEYAFYLADPGRGGGIPAQIWPFSYAAPGRPIQ
jgi:hypothetical protein